MNDNASDQFTYQPGVCNIDNAGVLARKRLAYFSIIAGVIALTLAYYLHIHLVFRVMIGGASGYAVSLNFLQAKEHFCVMNAIKGTYEISLNSTKIANDIYKDLDRKKMRSMMARTLIYTIIGGCLGLLPL